MVRQQSWLMAVVGAFLIGCAFVLVVGCSGDTGSQSVGSQDSEESEATDRGSEYRGSQTTESTEKVAERGGSQESEESESTHEEAEHSESIKTIPNGSIMKIPNYPTDFLMKVDGITYYYTSIRDPTAGSLDDGDLGPKLAKVNRQSTSSTAKDQAASNPVPVYAVKGYDTSFRLAARMDDYPMMFEAFFNPKANEASDVLDIGGKVSIISISHWRGPVAGGLGVGYIKDPEKVERVVRVLMDAPLKPTSPDHFGTIDLSSVPTNPDDYRGTKDLNHYGISFRLKDGTWVIRDYRMDTGRLSKRPLSGSVVKTPASGIVTPPAFRAAVKEAVKKFLEEQEAEKAEELRQKRSCRDTRTTEAVRRINIGYGAIYITNDVPGGPWGGVLRGTEGNDKLAGENGEDEIQALGGDDRVQGGACDDKVYGGPGDDGYGAKSYPILGGDGRDVMYGGPGRDYMLGERGDDVLYGGSDNEELDGGSGKDILHGGDGNDTLSPTKDGERDEIYCGKGEDIVYVGHSADKIDYVDKSCEEKQRTAPLAV